MKMKLTGILIAAIVILVGMVSAIGWLYQNERGERIRMERNQTSLLNDVEHYRTADSLSAAKIRPLELSLKELEKSNVDFQETIEKLNLKNKRLLSYTQVNTETKVEFKTKVVEKLVEVPGKDSMIVLQCMEFKEPYVEFDGCLDDNNDFYGTIHVQDSIEIAGSYEPRYFLGIIPHGIDHAEIDIVSNNPYTEIKWAQAVELKKKRRMMKKK